jgi:hypothetical protein
VTALTSDQDRICTATVFGLVAADNGVGWRITKDAW